MDAERRGAVLGLLLSGSTAGILLGRAVGGVAADGLGWRGVYVVAAVIALAMAAVLAVALPRSAPPARQPYRQLLAEPMRLLRSEPELRRSCFYQATVFASFTAVWTGVALLLTGPTYDLEHARGRAARARRPRRDGRRPAGRPARGPLAARTR